MFRRLVFAQVLLGIVAFCIAEQNPEMLLIAGAMVALSWYVVEGPTGKPLPQWSIIIGAMLAVGWLFVEMWYFRATNAIQTLGHFTIWLQVLQLYGHKNNRDYTLLLVLSLLQMVGATVLSVSVVFGFMLIVYCVLALFTVLVFQFKSTSDLVFEATRKAAPRQADVDRPKAVIGRGYRWQFRLLAIMVGTLCGLSAMFIFLLLPRGEKPHMDTDLLGGDRNRTAGFSPSVQLGVGAPPTASREPVLNFKVSYPDSRMEKEDFYYLRGAVLDTYLAGSRTWVRGDFMGRMDLPLKSDDGRNQLGDWPTEASVLVGQVTMRSRDVRHLFTVLPIAQMNVPVDQTASFNPVDLQLVGGEKAKVAGWSYQFRSPLTWDALFFENMQTRHSTALRENTLGGRPRNDGFEADKYARGWQVQANVVARLAQQVLEQAGLSRDPQAVSDPQDAIIAQVLSDYLRDNFTYTLVNNTVAPREDPVTQFLFRQRQGHCEIFAASLAAMCRSIGMRARVVTGYLAHDYNRLGGYFVVRHADAHAWTEVYCAQRGWILMDPTPPASLAEEHFQERGWSTWMREFYEHFEYSWITNIVGYDKATQAAVVTSVGGTMQQQLQDPNRITGKALANLKKFIEDWRFDPLNTGILIVIVLSIGMAGFTLVRLWIIRRRRLVALQLTRLPRRQRRTLAKRLNFYLVMLDMLERHGYERPAWQSPFSFAQELTHKNPLQFEPVLALTEHFYEIRFGHRDLDIDRRKLIRAHLSRLEETLGTTRGD